MEESNKVFPLITFESGTPDQPPCNVRMKLAAGDHVPAPLMITFPPDSESVPASIQMVPPLAGGTNTVTRASRFPNEAEHPPVPVFGATPVGHHMGSFSTTGAAAGSAATGVTSSLSSTTNGAS